MAGSLILVVEDDAMQAKLVSLLLEEASHTVQVAETAERALELLQSLLPDLILIDIELPGKDGLELTRDLRLHPAHAATPIVALTAYTHPSDLTRAREAGCDAVIWKPIDASAFASQVRNYLGGVAGIAVDIPADGRDLLAQLRNNFLAEGLEQCGALLSDLRQTSHCGAGRIERLLRRWAPLARTLGFAGICDQARSMESAVTSTSLPQDEQVKAVESLRRRFCAATCNEPKLPPALASRLRDLRIGLVDFTEQEANRIRNAATGANIDVVIRQINAESIEDQTRCDVLIVNECSLSARIPRDRSKWSAPAVFVGSRSSLESFSRLAGRANDFVIAPWDAEELLLRVHLLIGKTTAPQPGRDLLAAQIRRPRVLIADDDPDMVALVSFTLVPCGMDCEIARSGQQALDMVHRRPPDAIVLDVNLSDLDGFEVLKKLRGSLATDTIPVLMLTARNLGSDIALSIGLGADDYVAKPFDPPDLAARVEKMISASRNRVARR